MPREALRRGFTASAGDADDEQRTGEDAQIRDITSPGGICGVMGL